MSDSFGHAINRDSEVSYLSNGKRFAPIPVAQGKMQKLTYAKQYCSKANEEQNTALKGKNEREHTCGVIVFIALLFRSFFGNWRPKFPMQANTIVSFSGLKILFSAGNS